MIKKQNLWFLTLFSLILVLGVYYITMPDKVLSNNTSTNETEKETKTVSSEIEDSSHIKALKVQLEDERQEKKTALEKTLNDTKSTSEEKNNAYLSLKELNELQGKEEALEAKIKKDYQLDAFTKIDSNNVSIVIIKKDHDISLANKIMRTVQNEFEKKMVISIKFEE